MRLADPSWLWLMLLSPWPFLAAWWRQPVTWPSLAIVPNRPRGFAGLQRYLPQFLQSVAICLMVVVLARPQTSLGEIQVNTRGIAIVVAIDQSASMTTDDFASARPLAPGNSPKTRFEVAKATFESFVLGRSNDLIGLVAFATFPDLACPPTLDYGFLIETTRALEPARPGESSTNLGDAVAWSLDAIGAVPTSKKVLILLTDGRDAPGVPSPLDPLSSARLAHDLGVPLHTVAIGKPGGVARAFEPRTGLRPVVGIDDGPDLELLQAMAELGGGQSFEATDADGLANVFKTLDALERVPLTGTVRTRYREEYAPWLAGGLALLVLERWLVGGRWRRI